MPNFIKNAQSALNKGNYALAVSLYEQAILEQPELAAVYRFNLERARAKLGDGASPPATAQSTNGVYLRDLYREVAQFTARLPAEQSPQPPPLVSVVMTAHNVADYIEQAVTSLLNQTHKPLELTTIGDRPRLLYEVEMVLFYGRP